MPRNSPFISTGDRTHHVSWPLGGIGAPCLALAGSGGLDRIALRHKPDVFGHSHSFAALSFPGRPELARVLEGPVAPWRVFTPGRGSGTGGTNAIHHGLPRLTSAEFTHRFPVAEVALREPGWPLGVTLDAWSPFIPGDADSSCLPAAVLTWRFRNPGRKAVRALFSYHAQRHILRDRDPGKDLTGERIRRTARGFAFDHPATEGKAWRAGSFLAECDGALVDAAWFRGGWFDPQTALWNAIRDARAEERAPRAVGEDLGGGASLWLPLSVPAGGEASVTLRLCWYEPASDQRSGPDTDLAGGCGCAPGSDCAKPTYRPRYAALYPSVDAVGDALHSRLAELERRTRACAEVLHATDIPAEALAAATANLAILRSPTLLRQHDGRLWGWEGCHDNAGCCNGSCTHVWNYAQALPHLFPELERGLRETEFIDSQNDTGHQNFRSALPIRPTDHEFHAAADGQFGGIVKVWREWQISGDDAWLSRLWPNVKRSLEYCIEAWDPDRTGAFTEPHHNTYDIEFWGPDGLCMSFYAAALQAAAALAAAVGDDPAPWQALLAKVRKHLDGRLFRKGRYIQEVVRTAPRAGDPAKQTVGMGNNYSAEALRLLEAEGPKYQYGSGCLSDGVLGAWMAETAGLPVPMDTAKVTSHLKQIHRHNLKHDLHAHANPQRPGYAMGDEGGLLLCTWPDGGKPSLPFVYSDEVWTGIEYQVASHCILHGLVEEGLDIVCTARARYDGRRRNPFDEYECGHWYARALSSWALLQACSGVRYSAVERTLWIAPRSQKRPFRAPLFAGGSFGTVTLGRRDVTIALAEGSLSIDRVVIDGKAHVWGTRIAAGKAAQLKLS